MGDEPPKPLNYATPRRPDDARSSRVSAFGWLFFSAVIGGFFGVLWLFRWSMGPGDGW